MEVVAFLLPAGLAIAAAIAMRRALAENFAEIWKAWRRVLTMRAIDATGPRSSQDVGSQPTPRRGQKTADAQARVSDDHPVASLRSAYALQEVRVVFASGQPSLVDTSYSVAGGPHASSHAETEQPVIQAKGVGTTTPRRTMPADE